MFGIDRTSKKIEEFQLRSTDESLFNEKSTFDCSPNSSVTLILTKSIELDRPIDLEIFLFRNDFEKLFRIKTIQISIDEMMNSKTKKNLKFYSAENSFSLSRQISMYFNSFSRLAFLIESSSKYNLIEHFQRLLTSIDFIEVENCSNGFLRIDQGNIFEHALVHLVNANEFMDEELIVHFYSS